MTWINQNSFNGALPAWPASSGDEAAPSPYAMPQPFFGSGSSGPTSGDAYRPNWWGYPSTTNPYGGDNPLGGVGMPTGSMFSQFMSAVQQLFSSYFGGGTPAAGQNAAQGPGITLQDGQISSTGDPHIAVTGTAVNRGGATSSVDSHFDSMTAHADLFSTNDFGDGYTVSTAVTQPNASGVTYNASATATMNGGLDSVQMSLGGGTQVTSGGSAVNLQPGQTLTLSGGEQVSENANGSVTISEQNAAGATLATTFTNNGSGIDVTAQAHDVRLHGDAVAGELAQNRPAAEYL